MGDFADKAADIRDLADQLPSELRGELMDGLEDTQDRARRLAPNATGDLDLQLATRPQRKGTTDNEVVTAAIEVPEEYKYVEFGTGIRGQRARDLDPKLAIDPTDVNYESPDPAPPIENIHTWIRSRPVTPHQYDSAYELAVAIAVSIGQWGTQPHPFLRPAWNSVDAGWRHIRTRVDSAFERRCRQAFR